MSEVMEFGLLGPLVVRSGGTVVPVRRGHPRALLAVLLLEANRLVPMEAILEALWGPAPPRSAPVAVRSYVRWIRLALGEAGRGRVITEPHGYLIRVSDNELDLARFESLLASARAAARSGCWHEAAEQAREALSWWRGEPLADVESDVLAAREVPRLTEQRLHAAETRIEADLHLGGHADVVAELQRLTTVYPLREHLHSLLMLALYRCSRQADALAVYQHVRATLVDELGAEPGIELQKLHQKILTTDPTLEAPQPNGATGVQAPGTPRQLPATVAYFTGRAGELAALAQMLDEARDAPETAVICAISGTAGVGKTALAIHWAREVAGRYPDGQLYVNLRGFDPTGIPATQAEAIRGFLNALGVAPERIPPGLDAQTSLYRSLLADRRMLVMLDNARNEQDVRPLLPASPGCLVIITSRGQLAGLAASNSAHLITLDVPAAAEARQMLIARLGADRAAAEPDAVTEIADLCACLPLALAVAAARVAARPSLRLAALAAELRDAGGRLDALDVGDPAVSVRTVFSWSVGHIHSAAARMFRLLGLLPSPDITAPAAASFAGCDHAQAHHLLTGLTRAHLLTEHIPGRYACHDLLRAYAHEQAHATESERDRQDAIGRILDHYLHTARTAAVLLRPSREPMTLDPARPGVVPEQPADHQQAVAWFEAERHVLQAAVTLAAEAGFDVHAWQIAWAMADFLDWRGYWSQQDGILRLAGAAAARMGDVAGQAESLRLLAKIHARLGEYDQGRAELAECLQLCQQLGDRAGEARAHQSLAWVSERQGRLDAALGHAEQALSLYRVLGHTAGQARSLNNIGYCQAQLGNYEEARSSCLQALSSWREVGDRNSEAPVWDSLGYAEHHLGHLTQAVSCYQHALGILKELGDRYYEAGTLVHLGDTYQTAAELRQARDAWQQAAAILDDLQHPDAVQVRAKLATLPSHDEPAISGVEMTVK